MAKLSDLPVADRDIDLSRRALLGCTAAFTALLLGRAGGSRAQQKMAKDAVQYQNSPKGDQKCAGCRFFIDGGSCQLVEGEIDPEGWCRLFQSKA